MTQQAMKFGECNPARESLVMALLRGHKGMAEAIPMSRVGEMLDLSTRDVQDSIKHLIEAHGEPIGSATGCPHGYYLIATAEEQARAEQQLKNRAMSCLIRLARLRKTSLENIFGQIKLELQETEAHS